MRRARNPVLGRLLRRLRPYRARVALSLALAAAIGGLAFVTIGALVPLLDALLAPTGTGGSLDALGRWGGVDFAARLEEFAGDDPVRAIGVVLAVLLVLTIVKGVIAFAHEVVVGAVSQRVRLDLAEDLFDRLTRHDEATLSRIGLGNLTARFTYDLDMTAKALETLAGTFVLEVFASVAYLGAAFWLSWKLTLLAVVLVPVMLLLTRRLGRRIRGSAEGMLEKRAMLLSRVQETVSALPVVQVYGQEARERARFRGVTSRVYAWALRLARLEATTAPALEIAGVVAIAPVVLAGAWLVQRGEIDASAMLTVFVALIAFYSPLRKAVGASNRLQGGLAGAARVFETLDLETDVKERSGAVAFPPLRESVTWRRVTVAYPDGRIALRDVSLTAPAGRTTAIVGPSGAGKTTLVHTLPRLLDPTEGAVLLDGRDVREATLSSLRGRMALVTQDARLFAGTLAENVAYARPDATRAEVEGAACAARVDEIVARMPDGWDTVLDERGAGLSGGERQRIAIARAVLRDPEILLLDEPTAALDPENERLVRAALHELCRGRTVLVVAHRRESVESADHVVVLRDGRVEAEGTPEHVARVSTTYRELFGARATIPAP